MKFPLKIVTLAIITLAVFAISYTSCTKSDPKSTTIIKCVSCVNGGSCINDTCRCPAGYEGLTCQTLSYQKFIGEWTVFEKGSATSARQYSIEIEQTYYSSITSVTIQNLYSPYYYYYSSSTLNGTIVGDSIFIPTQTTDSGYIVGKGYYQAGTNTGQFAKIIFRYQVTNTITGITNDFGYSSPVDSPSVWSFD